MPITDKIVETSNGRILIGKGVPEAEAKHAMWKKILSTTKATVAGCWEWTGWCNERWGYGECSFQGKTYRLHRLVWILTKGDIPPGHVVRHKCDNPPCCNPDHLVLGTDADNVEDRMARGRDHHRNLTHCPQGHPYSGENLWVDGRGHRHCKTCAREKGQKPEYIAWRREYQRKRRQELKAKRLAERR